jgi:hypothetical protein
MSYRKSYTADLSTPDAIRAGTVRFAVSGSVDPIRHRSRNTRAGRNATQPDRVLAARRPALRPPANDAAPGTPFHVPDRPTEPQSP